MFGYAVRTPDRLEGDMQRGSDRLSVHRDDEMKHELQGLLRSGHPTAVRSGTTRSRPPRTTPRSRTGR
ncbi:hypothetical protein STAFG_8042 [Streptomyces afghaniensis 772]|uniref:Uncharacterized protein n=1 Tax=Streptomyces afghaniensis 772 TaxID=1283301 RepID=S4NAF9_9ACTN|nr:hypothetical protein STAFG_8042 [Streptomyces afghaniensis 772]